jgi:hypothetical protein
MTAAPLATARPGTVRLPGWSLSGWRMDRCLSGIGIGIGFIHLAAIT